MPSEEARQKPMMIGPVDEALALICLEGLEPVEWPAGSGASGIDLRWWGREAAQ